MSEATIEYEADPVADISDEDLAALSERFGRPCTRGLLRSFRQDGDRRILYRTIRVLVEADGLGPDHLPGLVGALMTEAIKRYLDGVGPGTIEWRSPPMIEIDSPRAIDRGPVATARCRLAVVPEVT